METALWRALSQVLKLMLNGLLPLLPLIHVVEETHRANDRSMRVPHGIGMDTNDNAASVRPFDHYVQFVQTHRSQGVGDGGGVGLHEVCRIQRERVEGLAKAQTQSPIVGRLPQTSAARSLNQMIAPSGARTAHAPSGRSTKNGIYRNFCRAIPFRDPSNASISLVQCPPICREVPTEKAEAACLRRASASCVQAEFDRELAIDVCRGQSWPAGRWYGQG